MYLLRALLLALLAFASNAWGYQVITDPLAFNSLFKDPTTTIDFTRLKDGSTYTPHNFRSLLVIQEGGSPYFVEIRETGWSDDFQIGTTEPNCYCAGASSQWDGNSIYSGGSHFYVSTDGHAFVLSVETSVGFMGFIPTSAYDGFYMLPRDVSISSLQYGYTSVSTVSEPATHTITLAGLGMLGWLHRRRQRRQIPVAIKAS